MARLHNPLITRARICNGRPSYSKHSQISNGASQSRARDPKAHHSRAETWKNLRDSNKRLGEKGRRTVQHTHQHHTLVPTRPVQPKTPPRDHPRREEVLTSRGPHSVTLNPDHPSGLLHRSLPSKGTPRDTTSSPVHFNGPTQRQLRNHQTQPQIALLFRVSATTVALSG